MVYVHELVLAGFVAILIAAAANDFRRYLIPNSYVLAIAALYPVHVLSAPGTVAWIPALAVAAVVFAIGAAFFAMKAMGGGDAKLLTVVALWAGPQHIVAVTAVILAAAIALAVAFALRLAVAEARTPAGFSIALAFANFRHAPILKLTVPYGVAVAAGGVYAALKLALG